jgi:methanogenic corrinoid protein MtbC1
VDPRQLLEEVITENLVAQVTPMSQEEFSDLVTRRMDQGKDMQKILREKFGVGSIREGIQKGIFAAPPAPIPGLPSLRGV